MANQDRAARRLKRGGDALHLSLDFESAESELARTGLLVPGSKKSMEEFFEKEWVRSLFSLAVEGLGQEFEARGKSVHLRLFERYDLDDSDARQSYADLAREFGLSTSEVTNYLALARREFRRIALEKLREMTADADEFRREARALFGVEPE